MKEFLQHLGCIKLGNGINYQPQLVLAGFLPSTVWVCLKIKRPLSSHTIFQQKSRISGERNVWFSNFQKSFPLCPRIYLRLLFIYLLFTMKISKNQPTIHVVNITCSMDFMGFLHVYPSLFVWNSHSIFLPKNNRFRPRWKQMEVSCRVWDQPWHPCCPAAKDHRQSGSCDVGRWRREVRAAVDGNQKSGGCTTSWAWYR